MAEIGEWYPPTWRRQPPGMTWEDWQAWQHWIAGPGTLWEAYAYDVELWTQPLPEGETDQAMLRMWARNTAKRIDAVGRRRGRYTIFEARRYAGWSAIGQLEGYKWLWHTNMPELELEGIWLVSEKIDDAIRATAKLKGIKTWEVGETMTE